MPDNSSSGELEDFVIEMLKDDDPVWPLAQSYIDNIPENDRKFKSTKSDKAKLYAWLATRKKPSRMGAAIGARDLNTQTQLNSSFVAWLSKLFGGFLFSLPYRCHFMRQLEARSTSKTLCFRTNHLFVLASRKFLTDASNFMSLTSSRKISRREYQALTLGYDSLSASFLKKMLKRPGPAFSKISCPFIYVH